MCCCQQCGKVIVEGVIRYTRCEPCTRQAREAIEKQEQITREEAKLDGYRSWLTTKSKLLYRDLRNAETE